MAKQTVKLYEALLQSVAALEGASQGLEGIASAGDEQQQHHKAHNLINDIRSLKVLHKNTWKKLLGELQVGGSPALSQASHIQQHAYLLWMMIHPASNGCIYFVLVQHGLLFCNYWLNLRCQKGWRCCAAATAVT